MKIVIISVNELHGCAGGAFNTHQYFYAGSEVVDGNHYNSFTNDLSKARTFDTIDSAQNLLHDIYGSYADAFAVVVFNDDQWKCNFNHYQRDNVDAMMERSLRERAHRDAKKAEQRVRDVFHEIDNS